MLESPGPQAEPVAPPYSWNNGRLSVPYPAELCPENRKCESPLEIEIYPGTPARLKVHGWVDLEQDMGEMVDSSRYPLPSDVPGNPAKFAIRYRQFRKASVWPDHMSFMLPPPETLPRSPADFWAGVFSSGAVFHVMSSKNLRWLENRAYERTVPIPAVPDLPATLPSTATAEPMQIWWPDGRIMMLFRSPMARWMFLLSPEYRDWTRARFVEATEEAIGREFEAVLGRLPGDLSPEVRDGLMKVVEQDVRQTRQQTWAKITAGRLEPTAHLLPRKADIQAVDWLSEADAVLVNRLLAGPLPDQHTLERGWLSPARDAWFRLRSFFLPDGHHSLVPGLPFLDEGTGSIHLKRVILPWIDSNDRRRQFGSFPPTSPKALETVIELLQRLPAAAELTSGRYRCSNGGVSVTPDFSLDPEQIPADRLLQLNAIELEIERLREIRRQLGSEAGAWVQDEEKYLRETLRSLRRPSGTLVDIRLDRTGEHGIGLHLVREGEGPVRASPLHPTEFALEANGPDQLADLPALAGFNGMERSEPAVANALLAARINGLDGPALAAMLTPASRSGCLPEGAYDTIRLRWSGSRPGAFKGARLLPQHRAIVLELDLAGTDPDRLQDALADLCPSGDD
jgi:hypothetical protein